MITDWKKEIVIAYYVQQETEALDTRKVWKYYLPKVAATEQELAKTESILGYSLDARYREFLRFANGWRCFCQDTNLFGTEELCDGTSMQMAHLLLDAMIPDVFANSGVKKESLLPIAVSSEDNDVFVVTRENAPHPGMVIWFAGYEIDRFATFDDFFLAMVDYNRLRYQRLKNGELS